ncbi:hypothetical protein V8G54_031353 [Vigna mungo]|uniref:F-box domain-containing protein n=1 Tax=Vigna mungo TaxID=3915 RepID=A0AAQ3MY50_VIGMU
MVGQVKKDKQDDNCIRETRGVDRPRRSTGIVGQMLNGLSERISVKVLICRSHRGENMEDLENNTTRTVWIVFDLGSTSETTKDWNTSKDVVGNIVRKSKRTRLYFERVDEEDLRVDEKEMKDHEQIHLISPTKRKRMKEQELPEGCIAEILSYAATPADLLNLSLVSKAFASASEYDTVWDRFIPSDLSSFLPSSSIPSSTSKKALYYALSDNPTIIDQGKKVRYNHPLIVLLNFDPMSGKRDSVTSFQLEKRNGKKCFMLSARDLNIIWGGTSQYWKWTNLPQSRFEEVARLYAVCWLEISGKINIRVLSPNTLYAAFLVFKMIDASGFHHHPVELSVGILGGNISFKNVCLDPSLEDDELDDTFLGLQRPSEREDGWLEIEMGEFFNSGMEEDELHMKIKETTSNMWKHGFILEGIEVRPKHVG